MSHLRQTSTPCSARKSSNSILLPRTPSAFQSASRRAFTTLLLGRAAILSHKKTIFRTVRERAGPEGRDGTAARSRRVSSTQASIGRVSRRSQISKGDGLTVSSGTSCSDGMGLATHCLVVAFCLVGAFLGLPTLLRQASYSWHSCWCLTLEPF